MRNIKAQNIFCLLFIKLKLKFLVKRKIYRAKELIENTKAHIYIQK